ncbi:MAG: DNA helicase PcrA [Clostridiales bacterium]|nr:DNA helicase PcrA [Clostridiales bacterium]
MKLNHLNEMQKQAVIHTEGPLLILAGAGSGKTRVLTHRIAYLVEEQDVNPYEILAITFTNKAAKEMRERVETLIGGHLRGMWISTFHSACVRILRNDIDKIGYEKNFVIYDTSDQLVVMKEVLKQLDYNDKIFPPKSMLSRIGSLKDELIGVKDFSDRSKGNFRDERIAIVYEKYQNKLKSNNALDFDDLIMRAVQLLMANPAELSFYQQKFKYILVDEFQDTNYAQYKLASMLASKHKNLCVVGDDDQSIYGWRGADVGNILGFEQEFPNTKVIKLEQNYRSTKKILDAANGVVANNKSRKKKKLFTDNNEGEDLQYFCAGNAYGEAEHIAKTIVELIDGEGKKLSDFAVLYRTNAQSRVFEEIFNKANIKYRLYGGTPFYERKEIKDIIAYLRIIENTADQVSIGRVINVPKRGIGLKSIEKIAEYAEMSETTFFDALMDVHHIGSLSGSLKIKISNFVGMLVTLIEKKADMSVTEIVEYIYEKTKYIDILEKEKTVEAQSRIENLQEFLSLTVDFDDNSEIKTLEEFLVTTSLQTSLDTEEGGENTVTLMTLHSAKGLEFPVVFLPGMEESIFPSHMAIKEGNEEEERRLCYVGITRAMSKLYLSHAMQRTIYGRVCYNSISRFINEIPDELIARDKKYNKKKAIGKTTTSPLFRGEMLETKKEKIAYDSSQVIRTGSKVVHPTFGIGTVITFKDDMASIAFEGKGIKKISTSFVKLTVC